MKIVLRTGASLADDVHELLLKRMVIWRVKAVVFLEECFMYRWYNLGKGVL